LTAHKSRVFVVTSANVVLAMILIAEPVLFGRIIDAMSGGGALLPNMLAWATLGVFSTVSLVLVARQADRLAHRRRVEVLTESFSRVISMPLSWHSRRGTSNALHTLVRATDTLFSLWLEFMRQHLATAVALARIVPTAF
jgi:ATP-binding cassette subfamily B protein